ncbi:Bardet-Biedl syndrome 2 protein-like protein [Hypsibius exemplaris]|uniref:Bardet-Biedl syndrome 2 protein-like protein n=1 Tax=Hypsibius exemplaris TaxID=2072580 RepID=A0A1W0X7S0_HYPEX|nr:Bardet-Biedl syndrome 2 protein-like protein [Hypsibius exemplaris]
MLRAMYDLQLQHMIRPGRAVVGEFTEGEMYLAAANMANKVVISKLPAFSAYASRIVPTKESLQILNINQTITALAVGRFTSDAATDLLFIGTPTELVVYDVPQNREVFRKSTTGGASSIAVGKTGRIKKTLAIVGGESALQGFDEDGNEPLWTITGDNVAVLVLFDVNKDGQVEVIAGCDDHQIRVFRETEQIFSMSETDKIVSLAVLKDQNFVYGLANGTVGVYEQYERRWRVKSKSKPLAVLGFDVTGDGEPEILCGWASGKFEIRDRFSGNLLFKYQMDDPIAQILEVDDPRNHHEKYILVATAEGDVKAFAVEDSTSKEYTVTFLQDGQSHDMLTVDGEGNSKVVPVKPDAEDGESVASVANIPQPLSREDSVYDWSTVPDNVEVYIDVEPNLGNPNYFLNRNLPSGKASALPADMDVYVRKDDGSMDGRIGLPNLFDKPSLKFTIRTSDAAYKIPGVVIFTEGVFSGESYYHHPPERLVTNVVQFPVTIPKNLPVDMFITIMAGQTNRKFYYCHGELIRMKRFAMYYHLSTPGTTTAAPTSPAPPPEGFVAFKVQERINRFFLWASENFFLRGDIKASGDQSGGSLAFVSLRDGEQLVIRMTSAGEITVMTDSIDTAGDVVESLADGLTLKHVESHAHFPKAYDGLLNVFSQLDEFQTNRQRQIADIADRGAGIRAMLMKAEECKTLETWPEVKKYYMELHNQNKSILGDFRVQIEAHQKFTASLKSVSQLIDKAARLRVGTPKSDLFSKCRLAVQSRDVQLLVRLMEFGAS